MPEPYALDLPEITTERLVLRLAEPGDVPAVVRYQQENQEHLAASRPRVTAEFFSEDFWHAQVHASRAEFRSDRSLRLLVFERAEPGRVIGNINFTQIQRGPAQFCFLGYGVDREREGRGLMREALEAAIRYVFEEMNLHRVMANHAPWNERSGGLLRRLGFVVEGYARDYLYLDGRWVDHVLTSLTNPNWRER
ncbi:MAG TPA: GNAT family N-acetyltransferase [Longimicrobiaceae bacterium]|nr:GNAT family N-acetyltransferase [Longimicrobiaceae bacterium]